MQHNGFSILRASDVDMVLVVTALENLDNILGGTNA